MAKPYIHGHHASVLRSHSWRTVENSCPHLIPYLNSPSLKILDVGCGPGTITVDLASRVPNGSVLAIDPSSAVVEKATKYAEEKGVTNARFQVGDIFDWKEIEGVEEGSFDIVHAHQVFQHLQDPLGALKEMKKLTKPGGVIAVRDVDYSAITWYPEIDGMREWLDLYIAVAKGLKCDPNIGRRLHAIAMEAGFPRSDIEASTGTWTFSTPEELEFWCGIWAERTVQSNFKKSSIESGLATEEDLERIVHTWRAFEKKEYGWFALINGQIICHVK
ncbi:S-adenosyl-L-methionine-dependent methyltransferase [Clohesyomyces aquaticus]|uniref:S-adenosyl-L-methionine-dependent methyltransferase n=1 Tax=Clohesyomyces aquaticus TaxID=1231657 RepID=A0A1Y1ZEI9_9PLEO|nr:S-adenosyl-L-methionine-dependent methyltransferase [Clohesyomyces aquaticus]